MKNTICLSMIVKNEAHIIRRCLDSVKPILTHWVIVDTGSTDGTQDLIREIMKDIPGELYEEPWKNFGYNRTQSLQYAQGKAEYTFVIDADDYLEVLPSFNNVLLEKEAYYLKIIDMNLSYERLQLFKNSLQWSYVGVLHEYPDCDSHNEFGKCLELVYHRVSGAGARSLDPNKFLKDAAILEQGIIDEPNNHRYVFYLAQSYRDAGKNIEAYDNYKKRSLLGGWFEEVFYSLFQMGVLLERMSAPKKEIVDAYLAAYQYRPFRAEPLYALAKYFRFRKEYALALLFAERAVKIPHTSDVLFVDKLNYDWQILDEYAVALSWVGHFKESFLTNEKILLRDDLPLADKERIEKNLEFCRSVCEKQSL
ncbi:MAG: glycosyltransferase [Candidatus Riflemargulisbacteria bacterium]